MAVAAGLVHVDPSNGDDGYMFAIGVAGGIAVALCTSPLVIPTAEARMPWLLSWSGIASLVALALAVDVCLLLLTMTIVPADSRSASASGAALTLTFRSSEELKEANSQPYNLTVGV